MKGDGQEVTDQRRVGRWWLRPGATIERRPRRPAPTRSVPVRSVQPPGSPPP